MSSAQLACTSSPFIAVIMRAARPNSATSDSQALSGAPVPYKVLLPAATPLRCQ
jgi:hypothetical protein